MRSAGWPRDSLWDSATCGPATPMPRQPNAQLAAISDVPDGTIPGQLDHENLGASSVIAPVIRRMPLRQNRSSLEIGWSVTRRICAMTKHWRGFRRIVTSSKPPVTMRVGADGLAQRGQQVLAQGSRRQSLLRTAGRKGLPASVTRGARLAQHAFSAGRLWNRNVSVHIHTHPTSRCSPRGSHSRAPSHGKRVLIDNCTDTELTASSAKPPKTVS